MLAPLLYQQRGSLDTWTGPHSHGVSAQVSTQRVPVPGTMSHHLGNLKEQPPSYLQTAYNVVGETKLEHMKHRENK